MTDNQQPDAESPEKDGELRGGAEYPLMSKRKEDALERRVLRAQNKEPLVPWDRLQAMTNRQVRISIDPTSSESESRKSYSAVVNAIAKLEPPIQRLDIRARTAEELEAMNTNELNAEIARLSQGE